MTENKKIKKLQKVNKNSAVRFKKAQLRPERAKIETIYKPSRYSNEKDVYMMESDMVFGLQDNQVLFDISMLNIYKHVTSVEVRKDLPEKIVTFKLESQSYPPVASWRTISENLEDQQSLPVKEWAESIRKFGLQYENFIQGFQKFVNETSLDRKLRMREQSAYKRLRVFNAYPSFEMRYRMKNNQIKCSELCFNDTFIQEAGYTIDNFTALVLSNGLPQIFPSDCPAMLATIKNFMQNLNYTKEEIEFPEQETDLLMKSGQRKRVQFQPLMLMELTETDLILSLIFVIKMKSQPFGSYQKQSYSSEFFKSKMSANGGKQGLFEAYYHGKGQTPQTNHGEKVCKIKEIKLYLK